MQRCVKLRRYCRDNGYGLETCKRKGWWMITMKERPTPEAFIALEHDIKEIGYSYFQDGMDINGYFVIINTWEV